MANVLFINRFQSLIQKSGKTSRQINPFIFGQKVGFVAKLFGCWHENLSRPFTQDKIAYRSCLNCGARKQFNPETLETHGNFYFPPVIKVINEKQI